jgi:hypothetical protein
MSQLNNTNENVFSLQPVEIERAQLLQRIKECLYDWYFDIRHIWYGPAAYEHNGNMGMEWFKKESARRVEPWIDNLIHESKELFKNDFDFYDDLTAALYDWETEVNQKCKEGRGLPQPRRNIYGQEQYDHIQFDKINPIKELYSEKTQEIFQYMYWGTPPGHFTLQRQHQIAHQDGNTCKYAKCLIKLFRYIQTELNLMGMDTNKERAITIIANKKMNNDLGEKIKSYLGGKTKKRKQRKRNTKKTNQRKQRKIFKTK